MQSAPSICLAMIVKNEAHILKRCLESVLPYIDSWAICDTGSTDGTQELIRQTMAELPGVLREEEWVDFGANRTRSLQLAAESGADYTLMIDADEVLVIEDPMALAHLGGDAYRVEMRYTGGISWPRVNIMRTALHWRYVGVIHEYATCDPEVPELELAGVHMWTDGVGARGQDPEKAQRDLAIMQQSVIDDPGNWRYWFYLAQGYEVAGDIAGALTAYEKRISMGGASEDLWFSRYRTAHLCVLQKEWHKAIVRYLAAFAIDPSRAEPLFWLAQGYIDRRQDVVAMVFLEAIAVLPKPHMAIFVENNVYDYLRWINYAFTAHNLGRFDDAQDVASRLLVSGKLPESFRAEVERLALPADAQAELMQAGG